MSDLYLSATKWLAGHADYTFTLGAFIVAGTAMNVVAFVVDGEKLSLRAFVRHFIHSEDYISHSTKIDIFLFLCYKVTHKFSGLMSAIVTASIVSLAAKTLSTAGQSAPPPNQSTIILVGVAIFVCTDLGLYCSHRLQHKIATLWDFHRIHHSATTLTPLTNYRFHPVENVVNGMFGGAFMALPMLVAECFSNLTTVDLLLIGGTANIAGNMLVLGALHHSHFRISFGKLDYVFMSPAMHQLHHSAAKRHGGRNLGVHLSIWDFCFGTGLLVTRGERVTYGSGSTIDDIKDRSMFWCSVGPFMSMFGRLQRSWQVVKSSLQAKQKSRYV